MDATLLVPGKPRGSGSPFGRTLFGDDFFDSFFTPTEEKQIRITRIALRFIAGTSDPAYSSSPISYPASRGLGSPSISWDGAHIDVPASIQHDIAVR